MVLNMVELSFQLGVSKDKLFNPFHYDKSHKRSAYRPSPDIFYECPTEMYYV